MGPILMSRNGNYILTENNLYSFIEDKTYSLNEMSFERMTNFFKENSTYLYKNKLMESVKIISIHRKLVYQICEQLNPSDRTSMIMEFEAKFGNLITENTLLFESWLSTAYDWTIGALINRVKSYGPAAIKLAKDLFTLNVPALMEDLREILFSPEGMAIEAILLATGIGGAVPMILWGVLLAYDCYMKFKGDPQSSWFNIIIDAIGCASAGGLAYLGKFLRSTGIVAKTAGKGVEEAVIIASKNPATKEAVQKAGGFISKKMPVITKTLKDGAEWAAKKLKINWLGGMVDKFSGFMANILDKIGVKGGAEKLAQTTDSMFGKTASGRTFKQAAKVQAANQALLKQGVKSGVKQGALAYGFIKGAETETGQRLINKGLSAIGQNPYDDILKAGKTTGLDFGPVVP